ncbi:allatostatin-A receptor-like [Acanthaster planci]|uniref:Allatostatin-A receptor-like n=1 Tax=Acanthaster planci TaxID=133434 RepID=A0A8B7XM19_ACAPL|nr:allatostatin-A receptor-like [Acanthaster planci]
MACFANSTLPDDNSSNWNDSICVTNLSETLASSDRSFGRLRLINLTFQVLGILGNIGFLAVVHCHKPLRNSTNVYLANLAVSDILVLVFGIIATTLNNMSNYRPSDWIACSYHLAATVPYYSSMYLVSLVAWDQYLAVCRPFKHRIASSHSRNTKLVVAAWTVSIMYTLLANMEGIVSDNGCRILQPPMKQVHSAISVVTSGSNHDQSLLAQHLDLAKPIPFVATLLFNVVAYVRIIRSIRRCLLRRAKSSRQQGPRWLENLRKWRIQITRMLVINTVLFFGCNLMRMVLLVASYIQKALGSERLLIEDETLSIYSFLLLLFRSSINPLMYGLTNATYRQGFRTVLLACCCRHHRKRAEKPAVFHLKQDNI